jgi:hypothetical protein
MTFTELQKNYLKKQFYRSGGSENTILKPQIVEFAESLGLEIKKKFTKDAVLDLIFNSGNGDKLYDRFGKSIDVPYWDAAKLNGVTYKQLSDLEQYEVIKRLEYTGWKDSTLYSLSVLGFDEGQLLQIWNDKNKTNFHRTRIDIKSDDEIEPIINQLSKVFEVENVSKPYPHREFEGYYIYLSVRSLNAAVTNDNFKNQENAKLKLENSTLKAKVKDLESDIYKVSIDSTESPAYLSLKERFNSQKEKIRDAEVNKYKIDMLEKMNAELNEKLKATSGGRPQKFTDQDKETMKMYRLQGKSIRYIAKAFECSTGLVHKIVSEE